MITIGVWQYIAAAGNLQSCLKHKVVHSCNHPGNCAFALIHPAHSEFTFSGSVALQLLYDTFSAFGVVTGTPKIMRDPDTGNSKGFGFISYDCFEASDAAIEAMNGQYLCNRAISVSYAYKKDTKGERKTLLLNYVLQLGGICMTQCQPFHTASSICWQHMGSMLV